MASTIILYSGVKFSKSYDDVCDIYGANLISSLASNSVYQSSSYSFIRKTGQIQVECSYATAVNVNYMAFNNGIDYSDKWFFAFVDNIEYRNEHNILIDFTIDDWHTYAGDGTFLDCFVEREHYSADGKSTPNLIAEPIQPKLHYVERVSEKSLGDWCIIVCYTAKSGEDFTGCIIDEMVSGAKLKKITINRPQGGTPTMADFATFCNQFQGDYGTIVSMFMYPADYADVNAAGSVGNVVNSDHTINAVTALWGYTPKNYKCLCYPYTYMLADSGEAVNMYRLEKFLKTNYVFRISGAAMPTAELECYPLDYNGFGSNVSQDSVLNPTEKLPMSSFPQVAFPIDSYKSWVAQCQSSALIGAASSLASGLAGAGGAAATGGNPGSAAVGVASSAVGGALGFWQADTAAQDASNKWIGAQTASIDIAKGLKAFRFKIMAPPLSELQSIDDYFSMFGYQTNRVKTPNTHTRTNWNFIKTSGQTIAGAIPQNALTNLNNICNKGVTIWHDYSKVGNYGDMTNAVIGN